MKSPDPLATYKRKRDFSETPEPMGGGVSGDRFQFVVQKHWASRLHYDFRLELDGTMKSWAIPKGPSLDPKQKRMAVQVEDHPIAYNRFEGEIPPGQYGAGKVIIWDQGYWEPLGDPLQEYQAGKMKFVLRGHKLQGRWALVRMRSADADKQTAWLLIKEADEYARPASTFDITEAMPGSVANLSPTAPDLLSVNRDRTEKHTPSHASMPLPQALSPELASLVDLQTVSTYESADWLWELKFDGYRLLARIENEKVQLFTRSGHDWSSKLPELAHALQNLKLTSAWIDGEVVMPGENGIPDFQALQNAFDSTLTQHLVFYAFDLPFLNGEDLRAEPLTERRAQLERVLGSTDHERVRMSEAFHQDPVSLLSSACKIGFEGIIGKRKASAYSCKRSADWVKLKCGLRQEFVIGGYTDPKGSRTGIGSLLLGVHPEHGPSDGGLKYVGNVGTGFSEQSLQTLQAQLNALSSSESPFLDATALRHKAHWVKPQLVAEVSFAGWTREERLRHAVFHGLRSDKLASQIVREVPMKDITGQDRASTSRASRKASVKTAAPAVNSETLGDSAASVALVRVSNPDRVIDHSTGVTKLALAEYYDQVAPLMLPHLRGRPTSLVRAPDGLGGDLFFQKHLEHTEIRGIKSLAPGLDPGHAPLMEVVSAEGLVGATQMNVIEFHTWNAKADLIERPDRMTFDLDPGEGVAWKQVQEAAQLVKVLLEELGFTAFLKTSGGKGLHIVVPIQRRHGWDAVKNSSKSIVQHLAQTIPERFVAKSGPQNRKGKIFVDYLRNGRGATTVSAWSVRARPGMGVSVPVTWDELTTLKGGNHWTILNADSRFSVGNAAWQDYDSSAVSLTGPMKQLSRAHT